MGFLTGLFGELLKFLSAYTGDYGISIVCLTVLVKLFILPLQIFQRRSMGNSQGNPSGFLVLLLQLFIALSLYRSISTNLTAYVGTKLLPWVKSLLVRDAYGILPVLSVLVQLLPQLFPYLAFFQSLKLPKPGPGTLLTSAVITMIICFPLPSGVGIYYLTSGLFAAAEQTVWNIWRVRQMKGKQAVVF